MPWPEPEFIPALDVIPPPPELVIVANIVNEVEEDTKLIPEPGINVLN